MHVTSYHPVLDFWFKELSPKHWWQKDTELDTQITERFGGLRCQALAGELYQWRETAEGRLAEIILLDQFSRNICRDHPDSFAADAIALVLSQEAIACGADQQVDEVWRPFFYLPFMHSESLAMQNLSIKLYEQLAKDSEGRQNNLDFAIAHRDIVVRFGRYPHRNEILGRESTLEETGFLKQSGSSF